LCRFKRRTASAGARCVWIYDPKTGAGQTTAKIQGRAAQMWDTFVVDKKMHSIPFHDGIAIFFFRRESSRNADLNNRPSQLGRANLFANFGPAPEAKSGAA